MRNMRKVYSVYQHKVRFELVKMKYLREVCVKDTKGFQLDNQWQHVMRNTSGQIGSHFDLGTNAMGRNN
jgi:hypothetical protein